MKDIRGYRLQSRAEEQLALALLSFTGKLIVVGYGVKSVEYNISRLMAFDAEIIGMKAAMGLILSGEIISVQEAGRIGLVNQVLSRDVPANATKAFVAPYLALSASVLCLTKKAVKSGMMDPLEESLQTIEDVYLKELPATADAQEGLVALLEKRRPQWHDV